MTKMFSLFRRAQEEEVQMGNGVGSKMRPFWTRCSIVI